MSDPTEQQQQTPNQSVRVPPSLVAPQWIRWASNVGLSLHRQLTKKPPPGGVLRNDVLVLYSTFPNQLWGHRSSFSFRDS
jgi:hypothetical protein